MVQDESFAAFFFWVPPTFFSLYWSGNPPEIQLFIESAAVRAAALRRGASGASHQFKSNTHWL